jgi:hypothetical protein
MKVVINRCYGGFSLSGEAIELYLKKKDLKFTKEKGEYFSLIGYDYHVEGDELWYDHTLARHDPILVQVVEELGDKANGRCAELDVIEIPDDVDYEVEEYDGKEWIAERHRTWG